MPLISHFYGILVYIYSEASGQHHLPHFHASYAEYEAAFDLEGNIIEGELPKKQRKLVEAWCELHREDLEAAWKAWNKHGETIKIEGLR